MGAEGVHPCLRCGACCATMRVSFYFGECQGEGGVPAELVTPVTPFRVAMLGTTELPAPRCVALEGTLGEEVRCAIWSRRSSTCRDFRASFEDGTPDEHCDLARARIGLPPLTPGDWVSASPPSDPRAPGTPPTDDRR